MSQPIAIISDIHGNAHALRAVLADLAAQGVGERLCLGDIVGYGASPAECIDLVRQHGLTCIQGNHDAMVGMNSPMDCLNESTRLSIEWTQKVLSVEQRNWLAALPMTHATPAYQAVHASLHQPGDWPYVLTPSDAALHFPHQTHAVCFIGHTHRPAFWVAGEVQQHDITSLEDIRLDRRQLVNVGAVGQPRDKDERACYVLYRPQKGDVWWRRVPYDIEGAQRAIMAAGLPPQFAGRLALGK